MQQELERWEIGEKFCSINLNERDRFGDLGIEWRIILKLILNNCLWGFELYLSGLGLGQIVERCECWNELSNYIQKRNLFVYRATGRRYSATGRTVRSSNPGGDKRYYLFLTLPDCAWGRPSLLYNWSRLPGRGVDHPPLPSAEVKNEWSYTHAPPLCLLWRVVGLPAERMLASQEGCSLGLHYYYCWIGICNSLYTGGADNIFRWMYGFLYFKHDERYLFSRHAMSCHLPPVQGYQHSGILMCRNMESVR